VTSDDHDSTDPSGPLGERDAAQVGWDTARTAWVEAARPVLLEAAGRYRALVTYRDLAAAVQQRSGITTSAPPSKWVGDVLARVAQDCQSRGEPLLSALCVSVQGSVGHAYADVVEEVRGTRPSDPDEQAAQERLECYRHWQAAGLPRDGGTTLRTAHFTPVRRSSTRGTGARAAAPRKKPASKPVAAAPAPKPVALCPRCFTAVPASGVCDYCD
jgi:hypothetical protein